MKVAVDVTPLGKAWENLQAGRSLSRVAEQVARAASAEPGVEGVWCSTDGLLNLRNARMFLARQGVAGSDGPDLALPRGLLARRDLLWRPLPPGASRGARLRRALAREAVRFLVRRALSSQPSGFVPGDLRGLDLYHSPVDPFPAPVMEAKGIARVITVHDLLGRRPERFYPDPVVTEERERIARLGREDWALCVSEATRDELLSFAPRLDPSRVRVVHLGVEERFTPCRDPARLAAVRERYGIPPDAPYLLSLAQMDFRKNVPRLMRAFARLVEQERVPGLMLVLAGSFWLAEEEARRAWEGLGSARERVRFTGWVEEEDLPPLYSGAEAFAFPSLGEGFGLPPLEAMACGVPVVAGNLTSLPEVVGEAGLLVDPRDEEAIAAALFDLHSRPALRAGLSRRGLDRAAGFTWERFRDGVVACWRQAAASS